MLLRFVCMRCGEDPSTVQNIIVLSMEAVLILLNLLDKAHLMNLKLGC